MNRFLDPLSARWQAWWTGLGDRDRRALVILFWLLVPVLLVQGLWLPSRAALADAAAQRDEAQALLTRISTEGPKLPATGPQRPLPVTELPQRLQQLASGQGLTLARMESDPQGVRVVVSQMRLSQLSTFLQAVQLQGVKLLEAQVVRNGQAPVYEVRLRLGS